MGEKTGCFAFECGEVQAVLQMLSQTPRATRRKSLLTAELQKIREPPEIAESPFANVNSQQSSETSTPDVSPDNTVSGGNQAHANLLIPEAGKPADSSRALLASW